MAGNRYLKKNVMKGKCNPGILGRYIENFTNDNRFKIKEVNILVGFQEDLFFLGLIYEFNGI